MIGAAVGVRVGRRPGAGRIIRHALLATLSALWLVPLYVILVNAFKTNEAIISSPFGIGGLTVEPLVRAVTNPDFNILSGYIVTAVLVILVNAASVAICAPAAYVLARRGGRRHRMVLMYCFSGAFVPGVVLVIPQVYVLRQFGLMGTVIGLVLVFVVMTVPISMFAYVPYIRSLPKELDEAAIMDGASQTRIFWGIIFPLMRPAVITVVILNTTGVWENFVQPYIILGPASELKTVTTAIYGAVGPYMTDYTIVYPNLLLVVTPLIIFYIVLQRQLIGGLAGSVKG